MLFCIIFDKKKYFNFQKHIYCYRKINLTFDKKKKASKCGYMVIIING